LINRIENKIQLNSKFKIIKNYFSKLITPQKEQEILEKNQILQTYLRSCKKTKLESLPDPY
jgi:hypothetical protein